MKISAVTFFALFSTFSLALSHEKVPNFHGKWKGECVSKSMTGVETKKRDSLKIVQFGDSELKIDGEEFKVGENTLFLSRLFGAGKVSIKTNCSFLSSEQATSIPVVGFDSVGGFSCIIEGKFSPRGSNESVETTQALYLSLTTDGSLNVLSGSQENGSLCNYHR